MTKKIEIVKGSGNLFRDLNEADADVKQAKALLAAEIIRILDKDKLSVRKAEKVTGYAYADFSRIRNADLNRFTIDKLMMIVNSLNRRIKIQFKFTKRTAA